MAKKYSKSSKNRKGRKGRKATRGGGDSFGAAVADGAPYASEVVGGPKLTPDCLEATRGGLATASPGGLPGFAGGQRMDLNMDANGFAPVMAGGRYTADVGAGPITGSAGPVMGGYPVISRIGCEGGTVNTSPPGAMANPTPLTNQNGGVGGIDSAAYIAPTAGYANKASDFVDSVGAPVLLQQPYDARIMNPACLTTNGGGKSRKSRKSRKNRKSRKSHRKYRK